MIREPRPPIPSTPLCRTVREWRDSHGLTQEQVRDLLHYKNIRQVKTLDRLRPSPRNKDLMMFWDMMLCPTVDKAAVLLRKYYKQKKVKKDVDGVK